MALVVKILPGNAGGIRQMGSILGSGRYPEGGHAKPLQYSCLENPMNRGACWATILGVAKIWTWLGWLSVPAHTGTGPHVVRSEGQMRQDKSSGHRGLSRSHRSSGRKMIVLNCPFLKSGGQILILPNYSPWIWCLDMGGEAFCCEWWFLGRVSEVNSAGNTF